MVGLLLEMHSPLLNWDSKSIPVKKNANSLITMLISFALVIGVYKLVDLNILSIDLKGNIILIVLLLIINITSYILLVKYSEKRYVKL